MLQEAMGDTTQLRVDNQRSKLKEMALTNEVIKFGTFVVTKQVHSLFRALQTEQTDSNRFRSSI